ncbi:MAG: alpha/beta hydrolase [Pseudomonadota bacterium]
MPTLSRPGATVYYEAYGPEAPSRPAIVFAHGAGGNAAIWFNQLAHFATDYRCIAFDHRCFARSPSNETLTVHAFRDDLLAIMDELGIPSAHLVGQSMGGFTSLRCALDTPDRVVSLTLSCTTGGIINPQPSAAMRDLTAATGRGTAGVKATMSAATAQNAALMQLYESINNFNQEFSWDKLSTLLGKDDVVQLDTLQQVQCPTLFISGAEDPLFSSELLASYVPHFPDARIEVIEDTGHSPYFERPDVFNKLLGEHLSRAEPN